MIVILITLPMHQLKLKMLGKLEWLGRSLMLRLATYTLKISLMKNLRKFWTSCAQVKKIFFPSFLLFRSFPGVLPFCNKHWSLTNIIYVGEDTNM